MPQNAEVFVTLFCNPCNLPHGLVDRACHPIFRVSIVPTSFPSLSRSGRGFFVPCEVRLAKHPVLGPLKMSSAFSAVDKNPIKNGERFKSQSGSDSNPLRNPGVVVAWWSRPDEPAAH